MAGKMLVERTIFWPGRSGTDAPLRRRSGRGKTGGGSLATGGAGRHRERYSRERGRKGCVSPRAGEGSHAGPWRGWGACGRAFAPTILPGMAREEGGSGAGMSGKRRSRSPDDGRRMTEKGTAPTGPSPNGPLVVTAGEARGPAAGGQRRREGSLPGPLRTVRAVGDKRSPAGIGNDAGGAPRSVTGYCGVSEGAQSGARSSKAV